MNINDAYPSRYLKASDLNGKNVTLTIKSAEREEVGLDKERKIVLGFANTEKLMVLNKTNGIAIAKMHGNDTDDWVGKRITLCARDVEYQGGMVPALRVLAQKPEAHKKAPPPAPPVQTEETADEIADDDIPF